MTPEKIIDPNDPEKTLQNVTDYLYQNLGNQIVKIPVTALLGKVDSLATVNRDVSSQRLGQPARETAGQDRTGPCGGIADVRDTSGDAFATQHPFPATCAGQESRRIEEVGHVCSGGFRGVSGAGGGG